MNRKIVGLWMIVTLFLWGCSSDQMTHQQMTHQEDVAERSATVMPFDLERSTHIFEKLSDGGLQQVVSDDGDPEQIDLIQTHLREESTRFQQGDFHDPAMIHGEDMAGLQALSTGAEKLTIEYTELDEGGQIYYTTDDPELVTALHAWFDQQVADHGSHAMAEAPAESNSGGGMMGMRGNGSMRVAHHATIPDEYANLANPVAADSASLERGGEIYVVNCAVCHGDGGMGDGPAAENLDPAVSPIAHTSQMLGEAYLFWRVSEGGKGDPLTSAMPAWKETLDEEARWDVINYMQALGAGTIEPHSSMGGAMFDPAAELESRQEMLSEAMAQSLITQTEADTFMTVHTALDTLMAETGLRMQGDNTTTLLTILVDQETITQSDADDFERVHDLLAAAGLMH